MRIELEPHEIRALGAIVAEELLRSLAPRLDTLLSPLVQRALPPAAPITQSISGSTPGRATGDILHRGDLPGVTGLSISTIRRLETIGDFPARIALSSKRVGWRRDDVLGWVARRGFVSPR